MTPALRSALLAARAFAITFAASVKLEADGNVAASPQRIRAQAQLLAALHHADEAEGNTVCARIGCGHKLADHSYAGGLCLENICQCLAFQEPK